MAFFNCTCRLCIRGNSRRILEQHRRIRLLASLLPGTLRRLFAASEFERMAERQRALLPGISGLRSGDIQRGRNELSRLLGGESLDKIRGNPGRKSTETKYPDIEAVIEGLLINDTAGDPIKEKKWVRVSSRSLSGKLALLGYNVNYHTVCRLLRKLGYSLKVNVKQRAATVNSPKRDAQFSYIAQQRAKFLESGWPILSVDCKKRELIGGFRANGSAWCKGAIQVNEHSFASLASCVATPYGVYDIARNHGYVCVGTSRATPSFAVASLRRWWTETGQGAYPTATHILLLADGGGSNGYRCRAWKANLQSMLCDKFGLTITVCHYPPRCSKYNPIERRLFSHISMNWTGKPLYDLDMMLAYIRGTTTQSGLVVDVSQLDGEFPEGERVSRIVMEGLAVRGHETLSDWNYTISPRPNIIDASRPVRPTEDEGKKEVKEALVPLHPKGL